MTTKPTSKPRLKYKREIMREALKRVFGTLDREVVIPALESDLREVKCRVDKVYDEILRERHTAKTNEGDHA